ncbi:Protein kinase-like domain [Pseudocohnilembus persalinus]|uniref:Protein kinase-like domain n=1 Tax=Pseudocohnilembus persalinus TaxID=266149 RepID=A0A0V0QEJ7_PSEPJ|nr:Protein kinase-like domain [Pseudocohnilembus persalinus]|eukprot:KRX00615.1 Protein kinase-like domain [Pseudocohnilembus persalinus]
MDIDEFLEIDGHNYQIKDKIIHQLYTVYEIENWDQGYNNILLIQPVQNINGLIYVDNYFFEKNDMQGEVDKTQNLVKNEFKEINSQFKKENTNLNIEQKIHQLQSVQNKNYDREVILSINHPGLVKYKGFYINNKNEKFIGIYKVGEQNLKQYMENNKEEIQNESFQLHIISQIYQNFDSHFNSYISQGVQIALGLFGLEYKEENEQLVQRVQDWQKLGLICLEIVTGKRVVQNEKHLEELLENKGDFVKKFARDVYFLINNLVHHRLKENQFLVEIFKLFQNVMYAERWEAGFCDEVPDFSDKIEIFMPKFVVKVKKVNKYLDFIQNNQSLESSLTSHVLYSSYNKIQSKFDEFSTFKSRTSTMLQLDTKTFKAIKDSNNNTMRQIKGPEVKIQGFIEKQELYQNLVLYYQRKVNQIQFVEMGIKSFNRIQDSSSTFNFVIGKYLLNKLMLNNLMKWRDGILMHKCGEFYKKQMYKESIDLFCSEQKEIQDQKKNKDNFLNFFEEKIEEKLRYQNQYSKKIEELDGLHKKKESNMKQNIIFIQQMQHQKQIKEKIQEMGYNCYKDCENNYKRKGKKGKNYIKQKDLHFLVIILASDPDRFLEGPNFDFNFSDYFQSNDSFGYYNFKNWLFNLPNSSIQQYIQELYLANISNSSINETAQDQDEESNQYKVLQDIKE